MCYNFKAQWIIIKWFIWGKTILLFSSGWKTAVLVWLLIPKHSFSLESLLCVKCFNSSSQYSASMNPSSLFFHSMFSSVSLPSQLGPNIKELFRLVEDFVDVIGLRMKEFQDMYEVTDNLGQPCLHQGDLYNYLFLSKQIHLPLLFFLWTLIFKTAMTGVSRGEADLMVKQTVPLPSILGLHPARQMMQWMQPSIHRDSFIHLILDY